MYREYKIGVVVPAYNESKLIKKTLASIPTYVDRIYAIDDASIDDTAEKIKKFTDSRIVCIQHEKNGGVGAAIISGYMKALEEQMDIVAVMAGDNQMDPLYLPNLLNPIIDGEAEYTKGNRLINSDFRKGMSKWRCIGNFLLSFLNKLASGYWNISDPQNGYTAISRKALKTLDLSTLYRRYAFENDILVKLNVNDVKVLNIPIPSRYGEESSTIDYPSFIIKTSFYFIRAFLWRTWKKYLINFHIIGICYSTGTILILYGVFKLLLGRLDFIIYGLTFLLIGSLLEIKKCQLETRRKKLITRRWQLETKRNR